MQIKASLRLVFEISPFVAMSLQSLCLAEDIAVNNNTSQQKFLSYYFDGVFSCSALSLAEDDALVNINRIILVHRPRSGDDSGQRTGICVFWRNILSLLTWSATSKGKEKSSY